MTSASKAKQALFLLKEQYEEINKAAGYPCHFIPDEDLAALIEDLEAYTGKGGSS